MHEIEKEVHYRRLQHMPFTQIAAALDLPPDAVLALYESALQKKQAFVTALESDPWYQTEAPVQITANESSVLGYALYIYKRILWGKTTIKRIREVSQTTPYHLLESADQKRAVGTVQFTTGEMEISMRALLAYPFRKKGYRNPQSEDADGRIATDLAGRLKRQLEELRETTENIRRR